MFCRRVIGRCTGCFKVLDSTSQTDCALNLDACRSNADRKAFHVGMF